MSHINLKCQSAKAFYFNFTLSNVLENRPSDVIRNDHHSFFNTGRKRPQEQHTHNVTYKFKVSKCQSFLFQLHISNVLENRPSDVIRNDHHAKFETSFFPNTVWGEKSQSDSVEVY